MNVAFIPVRGGSKSIPDKNIKLICGHPLIYWVTKAACCCRCIDRVYVATDSIKIKEVVESFCSGNNASLFAKVEVIGRSAKTCTDTATTESAMLEFASEYEFDNIVLIQATSPLLTSNDLERGFKTFSEKGVDSVISVVRQFRFNWSVDCSGYAHPLNYDIFNRPRRQEFGGYLVENGAFYISSKIALMKTKNRVSGNIKAVEMKEDAFFEIDEPRDWLIIEALMCRNGIYDGDNVIPEIKMFLTDCDGCLTDGGMYYSEYGDELKKFNTRDGFGFSLLKKKGILTGIVTSESVELNCRRSDKLKLDILEWGCNDKVATIKKLCKKYNIDVENVAYVGDDLNDIDVIKMVGFGCCPADAVQQVKFASKYISNACGGKGAIREIAELIIADRTEYNIN